MSRTYNSTMWSAVAAVVAVALMSSHAEALQKFRFYRMGEDDGDVAAGQTAADTLDGQASPDFKQDGTPGGDGTRSGQYNEFVDLVGGNATYVSPGRPIWNESAGAYTDFVDGSLALSFDGVDDVYTDNGLQFDPRDFGSFSTLSQGWFRPHADGMGRKQNIYSLGNEQGGVGISEDGRWSLFFNGNDVASPVPAEGTDNGAVAFGEWTHVAVARFGNGAQMWVNGNAVAEADGFWGGAQQMVVGNKFNFSAEENTHYHGDIDDLNVASFAQVLAPAFDEFRDIDFLAQQCSSPFSADFNCDSVVDQADYDAWSSGALNDNKLGTGGIADFPYR